MAGISPISDVSLWGQLVELRETNRKAIVELEGKIEGDPHPDGLGACCPIGLGAHACKVLRPRTHLCAVIASPSTLHWELSMHADI